MKGWVEALYLEPEHHLTYQYVDWVQPWPGSWMYLHVAAVGLASFCLAIGFHSRLAAGVYCVGFAYLELIDGALYLNHYWWVTLGAAWLAVLDVHNVWSIDVRRGRLQPVPAVAAINVWILRAQLGVVYVFAGLAKLNTDWLIDGNPLSLWLASRNDLPIIGNWLASSYAGLAASWAGLLFDCTIVGWLLWSRSRPFAYVAVIMFHGITGLLFQIGLFPLVMIAGTLVFFDPDWPVRRLRRLPASVGLAIKGAPIASQRLVTLGLIAALQIVIPLRHLTSEGNVRWTEEGYYLSWRVMLTEKTGTLQFEVTDPVTSEVWRVSPALVLTDWQERQASIRSDLLLKTAHLVAEDFADRGYLNVEVRAQSFVSFNGGPRQRYVDSSVDLATVKRGSATSGWLHPLEDPIYD